MCSIFGFNTTKKKYESSVFFDSMRHRGPDAEAVKQIDGWTLGHQRLSVIDTSQNADQPMTVGGATIVFNGEIYNYKELYTSYLDNEQLQTTSDTEVLLRCLNKHGISSLNKLNGMFAFAWFNPKNRSLYLCRDRFGVKPLHWTRLDGEIIFSSEIRPLATLINDIHLNDNIIEAFIKDTATDFNEETFLKGVYQVPAGHYFEIRSDGSSDLVCWYQGSDHKFDSAILESEDTILDYYEKLLTDAIRLRLRSDVPVCITLSGGLDSSIIYAIAKENLEVKIRSFHFMHTNAATDETDKVNRMVAHYNDYFCAIHPIEECNVSNIWDALDALEFPTWNPSALAYFLTYKTIYDSGFVVVLEGHGADEQLGGYPHMIYAASNDYLRKGKILKALEVYIAAHKTTNPSLGQRPSKIGLVIAFAKMCIKSMFGKSLSFRHTLDDAFYYKILPIVLRTFDRLTMANSLESRAPFMDYRLVEFHKKLPLNMMASGMGNKTILRKLLERKKLDFIYKDKVKMGFASDLPRVFSSPEIIQHILTSLTEKKFCSKYEPLRHMAIESLVSNNIGWIDVNIIWKAYSLCWIEKKYLDNINYRNSEKS
jgi:asparagine synthase (glutamine-hydrolysing)